MVRLPYTPRTGRQIPHTADVQTGANAFYLVPAGRRYLRGSQPCGKCRGGYQRVPPQRHPIRPAPPACVVPLELDHFLYPSTNTPPRLPQPRQRGLRLLPRRFRHARHNTMVQTGRHPNDRFLRLFVRYISTRFRPTPADFIGATTAFLRPNWPHRHPAKTPMHAPTAPPPTPRATIALLRLPATSCLLYTSPSPRD